MRSIFDTMYNEVVHGKYGELDLRGQSVRTENGLIVWRLTFTYAGQVQHTFEVALPPKEDVGRVLAILTDAAPHWEAKGRQATAATRREMPALRRSGVL